MNITGVSAKKYWKSKRKDRVRNKK